MDFNEQAQEETPAELVPAESMTTTSATTRTKVADTKPVVKPPQVIPTENGAGTGDNTASVPQQQQQHYSQPVQPTPNQYP